LIIDLRWLALRVGVDGLRLNPGNINDIEKIGLIAREDKGQEGPY